VPGSGPERARAARAASRAAAAGGARGRPVAAPASGSTGLYTGEPPIEDAKAREKRRLKSELAAEERALLEEEYESDLPEEEPAELYDIGPTAADEPDVTDGLDEELDEQAFPAGSSYPEELIPEDTSERAPRFEDGYNTGGDDEELEDIDAARTELAQSAYEPTVEVAEAVEPAPAGDEMTIEELAAQDRGPPSSQDDDIVETLDMDEPKKDVLSDTVAKVIFQKSIETSLKEGPTKQAPSGTPPAAKGAAAGKALSAPPPVSKGKATPKAPKPPPGPSWDEGKPKYTVSLPDVPTPPSSPEEEDEKEGPSLAARLLAERLHKQRAADEKPGNKPESSTRKAEDTKREELKRMADEKKREEERKKAKEERKLAEARRMDDERLEKEKRKLDEKKREEERLKEEARRKEEEKRKEEERKRDEARKREDDMKREEERKREEARRHEEQRRRDEMDKRSKEESIDDVLSKIGIKK